MQRGKETKEHRESMLCRISHIKYMLKHWMWQKHLFLYLEIMAGIKENASSPRKCKTLCFTLESVKQN